MWLPGLGAAAVAALVAWAISSLVPALPLLTVSVALGILVAQLPFARRALTGVLAPGLSVASKRLMRIGVVLLGLKLSLFDILGLGWAMIGTTVAVVAVAFAGTYALGRWMKLPGHQPLLVASGFAICGASAIGAMSGAVKAKDEDTVTPIALVTLCGTVAIAVLPVLWHPLGLSDVQFGHWVGAGVHDVGQVVATAQIAGGAALAVAIVVKLTRVVLLAPMVAAVSVVEHRRARAGAGEAGVLKGSTARPPVVPLFVAGFIGAILLRTFVPLPPAALSGADAVQTALLAMALFGLGSSVRLATLLRSSWRALLVGVASWALIAALALVAVHLT